MSLKDSSVELCFEIANLSFGSLCALLDGDGGGTFDEAALKNFKKEVPPERACVC